MMHKYDNADYMRKVFHDQVEWFINKYAPSEEHDPHEHFEFIADFCLVVRDLGVQGQQAYQHVATEAFKKMNETIALTPNIVLKVPEK
jgi:hypothetical protein